MTGPRLTLVVVVLALVVSSSAFLAAPAAAEWFGDLFIGAALPTSQDVDFKLPGLKLRYKDVDFDDHVTYGGRFGKYFDRLPWLGVSLDVMNYDPNLSQQSATQISLSTGAVGRTTLPPIDISVTALSVDLMLRLPLFTTKDIPGGRLQPYVLGGPALFFVDAHDQGNFLPRHQSDLQVTGGYIAGGGLTWQFDRNLGIFTEYRYSHTNPEFEFHSFSDRVKIETDLNTHHFLIGLTVKF